MVAVHATCHEGGTKLLGLKAAVEDIDVEWDEGEDEDEDKDKGEEED